MLFYRKKLLQKIIQLNRELERQKVEIADLKKFADFKVKQTAEGFREIIVALEQKVKNRTREYEQLLGEMQKIEKVKKPTKHARASRSTNNR